MALSTNVLLRTKSALEKKIEEDVLMASKVGDSVWLEQSLATKQIPLNFTDSNGLSAVHLAALECQLQCLKILIERENVDVNLQSADGWTSLHLAVNNTNPEMSLNCINYLLDQGANPSSKTSYGITPMHQAAACGNVDCLKALIDSNGLLDGQDDSEHTPYSLSVLWGHRECARLLKHHQWQKDKLSEIAIRRQVQLEEEEKVADEIAKEKKVKVERRLKGQKAYQLWLTKNKFSNSDLFGFLNSEDTRFDETGSMTSFANRQRRGRQSAKSNKTKQTTSNTKDASSRDRNNSLSKHVNFIPLNAGGSPTPGRRIQLDHSDKRPPHLIHASQLRASQKRGPLQFTVI
eukprot:gene5294-5963_t